MKTLQLGALAPVLLLAACGGGGDPAESLSAVRNTEQAPLESLAAGDLVGVARLYDDAAVLVQPDGSMLEGGAAIVDAYGDFLDDPNFALTTEPLNGWASAGDDLAVVTSHVEFTTTDAQSGEAVTVPMISQTVWERVSGSSWKIVSAFNIAAEPMAEGAAEEPAAE